MHHLAVTVLAAVLAQPVEIEPPTPTGPDADVLPVAPTPAAASWRTRLEIGGSASAGTSETLNTRLGVKSWYVHDYRRVTFDGAWWLATAGGDRVLNKAWGNVLAEFPRPTGRFIHFAQLRFDYDEQQGWDSRITAGAGLGYQLVDIDGPDKDGVRNDLFDLVGRLGFGLRREFGSTDEELEPEGIAGLVMTWNISETQRLTAEAITYPNAQDLDDLRVMVGADWVIDLDTLDGLMLELGAFWEYQSRPGAGIKPNEVLFHVSLAFEF